MIRDLLKHKLILSAIGAIVVIAAASGVYYVMGTQKPAQVELPGSTTAQGDITASGSVEPIENPDLSFETGGRITSVRVKVGDHVYAGEVLASLDTATLSAQRASAQARLDALQAGPRDTDKAVKEAAVSQAMQTQAATYATLASSISDASAKASDAVHVQADSFISNPNSSSPSLVFTTTNSDVANAAVLARVTAGAELSLWSNQLSALPLNPSSSDVDQAVSKAIAHLSVIRSFEDSVLTALSVAIPSSSFSSASISAAQGSVSAARTNVNGLITSLTTSQQTLISESLAINAAQAALNQLNAGASTQDIAAAQAGVRAIDAQIAQNLIVATFPGTVGSVSIKAGELAAPNTTAVTVLPDSALEVSVYVTEIDITRLKQGDTAEITLDAYGANTKFPAHVSVLDLAPSTANGVSAYKVTLSFDTPNQSLKAGMTANATIHPGTSTVLTK